MFGASGAHGSNSTAAVSTDCGSSIGTIPYGSCTVGVGVDAVVEIEAC